MITFLGLHNFWDSFRSSNLPFIMPFVKRSVEPVDLSNRPLPNDGLSEIETVTVRVSNNTMCGLVMQLANLAYQANSIFDEVLQEGNKIAEKAAHLSVRVVKLEETVSKLDARAVRVRKFQNRPNCYYGIHNTVNDRTDKLIAHLEDNNKFVYIHTVSGFLTP